MIRTETLEDFYRRVQGESETSLPINNNGQGHINIIKRGGFNHKTPFLRRDYYKITLVRGEGVIHYSDKSVAIHQPALIFSGLAEPSSCETSSVAQGGWSCLFSPEFMGSREYKNTLLDYPFFRLGGEHIITLDEDQYLTFSKFFEKMADELAAPYYYKNELIRSYLLIVMYEAVKIGPSTQPLQYINAAARTTAIFLQLLDRQFPIDSPTNNLQLKTAADYAGHLSVHINHLNRSVKEVTGKTTTRHIAERVLKEAQALLIHSDWNINQIAIALGFEEAAYFINFFKKNKGKSPGHSRSATTLQQVNKKA
jgi:AraC family transcriptional activator of pobA